MATFYEKAMAMRHRRVNDVRSFDMINKVLDEVQKVGMAQAAVNLQVPYDHIKGVVALAYWVE